MTEVQSESSNSICRLCSSVLVTGLKSIFGNPGNPELSGVKVADQIWECLQIKVEKGDGLPESVCQACLETTQRFTDFRQNCHRMQAELRNVSVGNHVSDASHYSTRTIKVESEQSLDEPEADDREIVMSSDNDDSAESQENGGGAEGEGEVGEPTPDDYVLMKEETFTIDPNKAATNSVVRRGAGGGGALGDHLVEFNNNSDVRDRDVLETQRARHELLPPMWDVYEKHRSPNDTGEVLVTHRRYIVSKAGFPCSLCGACFRFDQGCERGGSACDLGPYDCIVCHKVFPKRSAWKKHQQSAHVEDAKPFLCRECGKGFNRQEHLGRHLRSHKVPRPYPCDGCGRAYARREHLQRHHLSSPQCVDPSADPVRPFACPRCKQGFVRREHLVRHCKRAHALQPGDDEPKPFGCNACGKTFTRREHLRRHKVTHAKDDKSAKTEPEDEGSPPPSPSPSPTAVLPLAGVKCDVCGKTFSRRSHVLRHMKRIHNTTVAGAEVYGCDVCHKQFGRKYHLERHRLSHREQCTTEYECVTCGDKFDRTETLDSHMTAVHGNAAVDTFLWM